MAGSMPKNMPIYALKMDMLNYYSPLVYVFYGVFRVADAATHPRICTRPRPPRIRLVGLWLAQPGFTPKTRVKVRVMKGCLVITPE
jgi:hypothetical protein